MERRGKRNVIFAGLVSLFMDISSEMVYPLVPLFLANVLGVNKAVVGLIEGVAESTASLLKVFSGWLSDKLGRRKLLMGFGYGISTLSRPWLALSTHWWQVLGARFQDRFGKGIRTAPRDALIADSVEVANLGRSFGFHRSMDTLGAVAGPAVAAYLLAAFSGSYRAVFWCSIIPGVIAVSLVLFIKERRKSKAELAARPTLSLKHFDRKLKLFLLVATIFALGNSSDVFLILRARQLGIPLASIPLVYLTFNLIYAFCSFPAGILSDRVGPRRVILLGFMLFSLIYVGFAKATQPYHIWWLFGLYGIFMGLTEGVQRAYLAALIPPAHKATAFGLYHTTVGVAIFPASLIGGLFWDRINPSATFYYGAATALLSTGLFALFLRK